MSKTADEAWVDAAAYRQQHGITHELIKKLRQAVEATAREIAREELANDSPTPLGEQEREGGVRRSRRQLEPDWRIDGPGVGEIDPPAPSEGEPGEVESERARVTPGMVSAAWERTANVAGSLAWAPRMADDINARLRAANPPATNERMSANEFEDHVDEPKATRVQAKAVPAPSEGEQGEVDLPNDVVAAIRDLRRSHWHATADRLSECVAGLQRELGRATKEIARLRGQVAEFRAPENWRVEDQGRLLPFHALDLRYVGPPESEGESDGD